MTSVRHPSKRLAELHRIWRERLGEPPAIVANATTLAKVLRELERASGRS